MLRPPMIFHLGNKYLHMDVSKWGLSLGWGRKSSPPAQTRGAWAAAEQPPLMPHHSPGQKSIIIAVITLIPLSPGSPGTPVSP